LKELQKRCEAKGNIHKVELLKSFIGEKEHVPKTAKDRRNMVRKGPVRTASLSFSF
jgi:hypothetical protein